MSYKIVYGDTLSHHGILGMKWGQRQGPPYPLDASDHSAAEKKAGWRKSLNGGSTSGSNKSQRSLYKKANKTFRKMKNADDLDAAQMKFQEHIAKSKLVKDEDYINAISLLYDINSKANDDGTYPETPEMEELLNKYDSACEKITKGIVGSYGNERVSLIKNKAVISYNDLTSLVVNDLVQEGFEQIAPMWELYKTLG